MKIYKKRDRADEVRCGEIAVLVELPRAVADWKNKHGKMRLNLDGKNDVRWAVCSYVSYLFLGRPHAMLGAVAALNRRMGDMQ